jgi:BASS family bile acid:Na+ symporter
MIIKQFIEKNSGWMFSMALILGILFPMNIKNVSGILMPLMIVLLYISFLGINLSHVSSEIKKPGQLIMQIVWNFIVIPIALFLVLNQLGFRHFAVAAMLLAAMPAGLGSPVLTNIAGGRVETSVVLSVITHVLAPISVPILFLLFAGVGVHVDSLGLAKQMLMLIGIPIGLAYVTRKYFNNTIRATKHFYKSTSILLLALVAYLVIIPHAENIRNDFQSIIPMLMGTYILYSVLCISSYALSHKRKPTEQSAIVISRVYMNNALAIILAYQFFSPEVALITVLAEIPWFTTFGLYLWFQKKYIGLK